MVVEDETHTKELEEASDQKKRVGRIARLEDAEAGSRVDPQGKQELSRQRPGILEEVADGSGGLP